MNPRILWHHDYWDGPLSGIALFNGERVWFSMDSEDGLRARRRTYKLYRLTPELLALKEHWHGLFVKHVGNHTEYGPDNRRIAGSVCSRENAAFFYEPYKLAKLADPRLEMGPETLATLECLGDWAEGEAEE